MNVAVMPAIDLSILGIQSNNPAFHDGISAHISSGEEMIITYSPVDGQHIATVQLANEADYQELLSIAQDAFMVWREIPAPKRGEIVRQIGDAFRKYKEPLAQLVSYEMGKIYQEGLGEVQEIIDICDFAVGLSRQLYGLTMPSERPKHRLFEQWQPLGVVGIISAFNFPVAVWAWNAMLAAVCGNVSIWKPSEKTPLCAIACMNIISEVLEANNIPAGTFAMIVGDSTIGQLMSNDHQIPLISATGSTRMGKSVAESVAKRLGRTLLELGGNNAIIVSQHGDMNLALQATVFASVGTTGQRCTTSRRLIVHESVYDTFKERLVKVYEQLQTRIGSPLDQGTLIGPLIDEHAVKMMMDTLAEAKKAGANILVGGEQKVVIGYEGGCYATPTIVETTNDQPFVQRETFAPITYLLKYKTIEEAIEMQNNVPQGLSSSIFSNNVRETELFLSAVGSDCGIANVNIGPSGAEIGGAFGGEKETGGGRESGSDSWKAYMRRQTVTINYSDQLPLAQGIKFDV